MKHTVSNFSLQSSFLLDCYEKLITEEQDLELLVPHRMVGRKEQGTKTRSIPGREDKREGKTMRREHGIKTSIVEERKA